VAVHYKAGGPVAIVTLDRPEGCERGRPPNRGRAHRGRPALRRRRRAGGHRSSRALAPGSVQATSRPCAGRARRASCATRTCSAIFECHRAARCAVRSAEQPNRDQEDFSWRQSQSSASQAPTAPSGNPRALRSRASLRRLLVPRLTIRRRGSAARRRRRSGARAVRARRVHLRGRATRDEGERARAGVLRRRAPSRDHVPLDTGSARRPRAGRRARSVPISARCSRRRRRCASRRRSWSPLSASHTTDEMPAPAPATLSIIGRGLPV
jgi:hypothetical protein